MREELSSVINQVWENGCCEIFRMLDQSVAIGDDQQLYVDELSNMLIAEASRRGFTLTLLPIAADEARCRICGAKSSTHAADHLCRAHRLLPNDPCSVCGRTI